MTYYQYNREQRRPWGRFFGMLGPMTLADVIRAVMSPADRRLALTDLLAGQPAPSNGTERGVRIAALGEGEDDFTVRAKLLTLAAAPESEGGLAAYLGLECISPEADIVALRDYAEEEHDPARVDDAARPTAVKAAAVRRLFASPPRAPFGATLGDAAATKGGKRSKR